MNANDVTELKSKISLVENEIKEAEREIRAKEAEIKEVQTAILTLETQLSGPFAELDKEARDFTTVRYNRLLNNETHLQQDRRELGKKGEQLRERLKQLEDRFTNYDLESKKQKIENELDMKKYALNELPKFMSGFKINREASYNNDCLEFGLDKRLTANIVMKKNIVFLVAVSGAGKTRRVYEELYRQNGIFFTCSKADNGGSGDLETCIKDALNSKDIDNIYFKLLICSRLLIVNYLLSIEKFTPSMLLLAQIHPERVFKYDIFTALYAEFARLKFTGVYNVSYDSNFLVAVDEIQSCLKSEPVFLSNQRHRTVFSPLYKTFCDTLSGLCVIYSGTGLDYAALQNHLNSGTFKNFTPHFDLNFQSMTKELVQSYSYNMLQNFHYTADEATEIALLLSENPLLVGGRPRFTAYILNLLSEKVFNLEQALQDLDEQIKDIKSKQFPIKNWNEKKQKIIGNDTINRLMLMAISNYFIHDTALIQVSGEDAADLIYVGVGYCDSIAGLSGVVLSEEVIVRALFALIPIQDIASVFLFTIMSSVNLSQAGFHFEYLVMFKYYCDSVIANCLSPFKIRHGSLTNYITEIRSQLTKEGSLLIFPDNYAGPDIVLITTRDARTTIKIIQVKFTKKLSLKHALRTTDYKSFYCTKSNIPLARYQGSHDVCLNFFNEMASHEKVVLERYVIYQGKTRARENENAIIISKDTFPDFFNSLRLRYNVWDQLTAAQGFVDNQ